MVVHPFPVHNTREFNWNPETKTFSAEASTLRGYHPIAWPIGWPVLGRVYDDAADEGFTLVSAKTGKEMAMVLDNTDESADYAGGWRVLTFVPADRRHRNEFKIVVFND